MSDVKDILDSILSDEKLLGSRAFRDKVYTDQPIIKRASQIKTSGTPQKIKEMKALAYTPEAYWKTSAWLFYTQGKFMEDYTDVYDFGGELVKFYPTYRDLDTEQLRGYFSWRRQVREGVFPYAPKSFIYMHAYEMINGIGIDLPESGIKRLRQLAAVYGADDPELTRHLNRWAVDLCVYEELDPALVSDIPELVYDHALVKLTEWETTPDEELFSAISTLCGYPFERSRYYISDPDGFREAAVRVFRSISAFFRSHRKNPLCEKLFGRRTEMNCKLFELAVFYDRQPSRSTDYELDPIHTYTCRNGVWRCSRYYGNRTRNQQLGEMMRTLDCQLRERCDFRYKLRPGEVSKTITDLIKKELDALEAEKNRKKAMNIEIDLSKIAGIRAAADVTRDKLIVDEEPESCAAPDTAADRGNEAVPQDSADSPGKTLSPAPEPVTEPAPDNASASPLTANEKLFLQALLSGGDWASAAREVGEMPSLLADSINEKLFGFFGDTVIDCSADVPVIIEDYADELQEYV